MVDVCVLPNGLTVVGERLPYYRSLSVGVWVKAGSQYETAPENGVTHFLEHMLFKGTERRDARQIAEEMDAVGGQLNAFTTKDCTCFYAKVIDEHTELAIDMLSDLVIHAVLDEKEIAKEKGVVLEEISMVEDEPEDLVHELIMTAQFGDQPLAWPILGTADTVRSFTRPFVQAYRASMYRPECTVLAVAGRYDWDALLALIERYFGAWPRGEGACPDFHCTLAEPTIVRREKEIEQIHLCLAYPGVSQNTSGVYPMSIFSSIFGGAMSSRLFQKIREERGMAYSVYSFPTFYQGSGSLSVYAGANPENAPEVLRLIRSEIDDLLQNGVTKEEFETTRTQLKSSYVLGLESGSARMNALGRRKLLFGDTQSEDDVLQKIDRVRYDEVLRVLQDALSAKPAAAFVGRGANALSIDPLLG